MAGSTYPAAISCFNLPWRFSRLGTGYDPMCGSTHTRFNLPWRFSLLGTSAQLVSDERPEVFQSPLEIQPLRNMETTPTPTIEPIMFQSPLEIQPLRNVCA